jgi:hypothetical protein
MLMSFRILMSVRGAFVAATVPAALMVSRRNPIARTVG